MSARDKVFRIMVPLVILLAGAGGMALLIKTRPSPAKEISRDAGALVRVLPVASESRQVTVRATGTVQAGQEATIVPQVSGKVTHIAPNLVAGGFFNKGDLLFRIEDVDYRLAAERAKSAVTKAEYDLAREESNARVARQEWERLDLEKGGDPNPLVFNEPQLKNARAELEAAQAALEQARLDLERTEVRAPFNCIVRSEEVDLGQYVRAGSGVGVVSGTDAAEIVVPLPLEELSWLDIPRPAAKEGGGSPATVSRAINGRAFEWQGRVVRSLGDIDPASRMARLVVAVQDPYGLAGKRPQGQLALAVGMFVDVRIEGERLADIVAIPRQTIHENDTVWLLDEAGRLQMRRVEVLRLEQDEALVRAGLAPGERVVLTNLTGAAEGMKLRVYEEEQSS